jgi:hypothetical protein
MAIGDGVIARLRLNLENLLDVVITSVSNGQILEWNGTNWVNANNSGGGGSGFTVTKVSNGSPYTASTGANIYTIYNTSGSAYTFNLNASPATNDICVIVDAGLTSTAHTITVQGNGNTICAYGGSGSSFGIAQNGASASLAWDGTQWTQYA